MLPEKISLGAYQAAFAARIRDPRQAPRPPGAPARRMRVYEQLLFNNLEGFLLACYPVTRKVLGARAWRSTVKEFFSEQHCHSPLFRDIPRAFLSWLEGCAGERFPAWSFLPELMHYEWLELAVATAPEEVDPASIDVQGDLLLGRPALNPSAQLACYRYPVHRIGPRFRPTGPDGEQYCFILFRDETDAVRFIRLNPLSASLLVMLRDHRPGGRGALAHLAGQMQADQFETFLRAGSALLHDLRAQGMILGTWKTL